MKVLEPSLTDEDLARLERDTFKYFANEMNPENGLVPDNTDQGAPSSIAVVGFALTAYPIAVERGYMTRNRGNQACFDHFAVFPRRTSGNWARRDWLQGLLLSLSRHEDGQARLEV